MDTIRDLTDAEMNDVLEHQLYGHLACILPDGRPYVVPVTFVHDDEYIYGFSSAGQKIDALRQNPSVCFQTELLINEGVWKSVIAWGAFEELSGTNEIHASMLIFSRLDRAQGMGISPLYQPPAQQNAAGVARPPSANAVFYRIRITEKTGRHVQYD